MAKWADYLISGIWQTTTNNSTYISYVFLHLDTENNFQGGLKTSKADVIKLIKAGKTVKTIVWNYTTGKWNLGADVSYITVSGTEYLRSHQDRTVNDNLDNMIPMNHFI
jgi:hypothetical protein